LCRGESRRLGARCSSASPTVGEFSRRCAALCPQQRFPFAVFESVRALTTRPPAPTRLRLLAQGRRERLRTSGALPCACEHVAKGARYGSVRSLGRARPKAPAAREADQPG